MASNKKYEFNQQYATLKLREEIESLTEGRVMFMIDDETVKDEFFEYFSENNDIDYIHDGPDVYYIIDQNELQKFLNHIQRLGYDPSSIRTQTTFKEEAVGNVTGNDGAYQASLHASPKKQNPFKENKQEYFIQVDVRDAKLALSIIDDSYFLSNNVKKRSSDVYTTYDVMAAEELVDSLKQNGIHSKNNVEGYVDEDVLSGYTQDKNFRPGHTKDKGGFQYKDLWNMNENEAYTPSNTNAEELIRVQELLAQAHRDNAYSVMSSYEFRINMLKLIVALEKKHNTTLPLFKFGMTVNDYIAKYFPGFKGKFGPYAQKWRSVKDHIEQAMTQKQGVNEENVERDQKVKIISGPYAGRTAVVHDFDPNKDIASGEDLVDVLIDAPTRPFRTVKASELKPINENYAHFRNETKTRKKPEQFHQAVKSVQKKIQEISKLHSYLERLQMELSESEGGLKYKKYTENAIQKIKDQVKELYLKTKKMK